MRFLLCEKRSNPKGSPCHGIPATHTSEGHVQVCKGQTDKVHGQGSSPGSAPSNSDCVVPVAKQSLLTLSQLHHTGCLKPEDGTQFIVRGGDGAHSDGTGHSSQ